LYDVGSGAAASIGEQREREKQSYNEGMVGGVGMRAPVESDNWGDK